MTAPQMKERPASMLRAMFAGLGSLLNGKGKARTKTSSPAPAPAEPAAAPEAPAAESPAATEPEAVATPVTPVTPETTAEPEAIVESETTAEPEAEAPEVLPLANYDDSTVPSLRARLRNLSVEQLNQLIGYERAHADRAEVIAMFERRIAKVQAEG